MHDGLRQLALGTDYQVVYGSNRNVAEGGTVRIVGMGAYTGSCALPFSITPVDLSACTVSVDPQTYTAQRIEPAADAVNVAVGGVEAQQGDWTIDGASFGDNVDVAANGGSLVVEAGPSGNLVGRASLDRKSVV